MDISDAREKARREFAQNQEDAALMGAIKEAQMDLDGRRYALHGQSGKWLNA